jgi:hypothetical protein
MSDPERPGVEILGQRFGYPDTPWGMAAVGLVCLLGGFLAWLILQGTDADRLRAVGDAWRSITVTPENEQVVEKDAYRLEFWTPSARTKEAHEGREVLAKDKWEVLVDDSKVLEFGEKLRTTPGVQGFRRFEEFGHGRTQGKWGWWWTVGAEKDFTIDDLVRLYRAHWGTDDRIYVEVIRRRSEYAN